MIPEGQGQFIAGVGYSEGSRRFSQTGQRYSAPTYRKTEVSGFLEYGLTGTLSLVLAPTLAHDNGAPAVNSVTGSTSSALGARLRLWGTPSEILSVQVLVQPPIGAGDVAAQIANGGARSFATDVRALYGRTFPLSALPAFVDIEPGLRFHGNPFPTEARFDLTVGIRPASRLLVLLQLFNTFAPASGPLIDRSWYSKLFGSIVYDLNPAWSLQIGAFRTIAGRNAVQETGPLVGIWRRF